jgi:hypothetical protein
LFFLFRHIFPDIPELFCIFSLRALRAPLK